MKKTILSALALPALLAAMPISANAQEVSVSVTTDFVSEYVFRGVTLAASAIQPGVEASFGNFTVGGWASLAIGEDSYLYDDELDLYAGYSFDVSETISADVGATVYHYPQYGGIFDIGTDAGDASTLELYAGLSFDAPLAPGITAYYDTTLETFTIEGGISHSFPISDKTSFDLSGSAGSVSVDGAGDYQYGSASAALSYALSDNTSAYLSGNLGLSSEDTFSDLSDYTPKDSSAWVGFGIASGF